MLLLLKGDLHKTSRVSPWYLILSHNTKPRHTSIIPLRQLTGAILTHEADVSITGNTSFAYNSADRDGGEISGIRRKHVAIGVARVAYCYFS